MCLTGEEKQEFARRIANGNKTWNSGDSKCNRLAVGVDNPPRTRYYEGAMSISDVEAFEWLEELLRKKL